MPRSAVAALAALACAMNAAADSTFASPRTPARPVTEILHGVTLADRYRWLESGKDAEVVRWTEAQHDAAVAWLDRYAPPVPGMRDELTRAVDRDVTRPPTFKKGREFFTRTRKGETQPKRYTSPNGSSRRTTRDRTSLRSTAAATAGFSSARC